MSAGSGHQPTEGAPSDRLRRLRLGRGDVSGHGGAWLLRLETGAVGYSDAQIDDYGPVGGRRRRYPWRPGTTMHLWARFSHGGGLLQGTAGFGFWNAPFGDPTVPWPALPQAAWFFYGSAPTNLPLAPGREPGRGWFAATLNATPAALLPLAPPAPLLWLGLQTAGGRRCLWPWLQHRLGIRYVALDGDMTRWHRYELSWLPSGCEFIVDGRCCLRTAVAPAGPLGFVAWMDNQYLAVTPHQRPRWGTLALRRPQWLAIRSLALQPASPG